MRKSRDSVERILGVDDMRYSDERLLELERKFDLHDAAEREWREKDEARQAKTDERVEKLFEIQANLVKETAGMIQLSKDLHAAMRVGAGIQNFILWLMKWGGIFAIIGAGLKWFLTHVLGRTWP